MKKLPSAESRTDAFSTIKKGVTDPASSSLGGMPTRAHIEQLEDRLLYSADLFGVLIDPPETTVEFPIAGVLLSGSELALNMSVSTSVVATTSANLEIDKSLADHQPSLDKLINDDIASYLDSADLSLFNETVGIESMSEADTGSTINSQIIADKSAEQYSGRRTAMVGPTDLSGGVKLNVDGGNDSYLLVENGGTLFGGLTQFTVESQFAIDKVNTLNVLWSYATADNDNVFFYGVGSDGALIARVNDVPVESLLAYPQLLDGGKHALAMSWDSVNGDIRLYVDGELVHSATSIAEGFVLEVGGVLLLGQEQDSFNGGFDPEQVLQGSVYDMRIWNEVRSEAEIVHNYQAKIAAGSLPSSLIANWQMDVFNSSGAVVDIVSGNNLTVGHVSDAGFSASTPTSEFRIFENAAIKTVVGVLVPSVQNTVEDLVDDGTFSHAGSNTLVNYASGSTIGGAGGFWQVDSGDVDIHGEWQDSPLGGKPLDLNGIFSGSISQTLATEPGKTYQLSFALTGHFGLAEAKELRVSAGTTSSDFSIDPIVGWAPGNLLWVQRSLSFVATSTSTTLQFSSLSLSDFRGPVIGDVQVVEVPAAVDSLLAAEPSLSYDGVTNKFYMPVTAGVSWTQALAGARSELLNGNPGQLVTIGSAYENDVIHTIATSISRNVWIGASDQTVEGDWRWQDGESDGARFWLGDGDGTAQGGAYSNWHIGSQEPRDVIGNEDYALLMRGTGHWVDGKSKFNRAYVVEWDAESVLSKMEFSLQSDPGGAFAIDIDTGEITVASNTVLDRESASFHDIVVRVTHATGGPYDETFRIEIDDIPAPLISNIELSTLDYIENAGKVNITNTLGISTDTQYPADTATISIAGGYVSGQDLLAFIDFDSFIGSWDHTNGSLTITGSATDANWQDALRSVTYENTSDDPVASDRSIIFSANHNAEESNFATRIISVLPVNDVPELSGYDNAIASTNEDTTVALMLSDLQSSSSDVEDGNLHAIVVQSVKSGTLFIGVDQASASPFTFGITDTIDSSNNAYWLPDSDANGSIDAFVVRGIDSSNDLSASAATVKALVKAVNDPPVADSNSISLRSDSFYRFNSTDFGFRDPVEGDQLSAVQITGLPDRGELFFQGALVTQGQEMMANAIALGQLYYEPRIGVAGDQFTTQIEFTVQDDGGSENGGADQAVDSAVLTLVLENEDEPPVTDVGKLKVVENSPAGTVIGRLDATDPDPVTTHLHNGGFFVAQRIDDDANRYAADGGFLGSDIAGWRVVSGNVDVRGRAWSNGPEGGYLLDLNGSTAGAIEQTIETIPGARYSLIFAITGHFRDPGVSDSVVEFEVSAGDTLTEFQVEEQPGWSQQNPHWQHTKVTFTATDNTTTIGFRSLTSGNFGAIVADIRVQDEINFELINANSPFSINEDGTIVVADASLDHETQSSYALDVKVSETDGRAVTISVPIEITDINESPQLLRNELLTATTNAEQIIDRAYLAAVDEDETDLPSDALTYRLVKPPANGVLQLNGIELNVSDSFTQQDINQKRLSYSGITAGTDSFTFRLADGGEGGVLHTEAEFLVESYDPLKLEAPNSWVLNDGGLITLGASHLDVSGGNTDEEQLRVNVISVPSSVQFRNTQTGLIVNQFTMLQQNDGLITLNHESREPVNEIIYVELYRTDTGQPILVDSAKIALEILDVAEAPSGSDSELTTDHTSALTINANQFGFDDSDDGDDLQAIVIVSTPVIGSLLLAGNTIQPGAMINVLALQNNELQFVPDPLTSGTVTEVVEFMIVDSGDIVNGGINVSEGANTISITVTSNHSPQATADNIVVDEGGIVSSLTSGDESVISNDTDLDSFESELLVQLVNSPLHGTVQLNRDGTFVYRHDGSETITDSFQYMIVDEDSEFAQGTGDITRVDIEIVPRNDSPEAGQVESQVLVTDEPFAISLPDNLFTDVDSDGGLILVATLSNGAALPDWITFDATTGVFSGTPDNQADDKVVVIVSAADADGATAQTSFEITVEPKVAAVSVIGEKQEEINGAAVSSGASAKVMPTAVNNIGVAEKLFTNNVSEAGHDKVPAGSSEGSQSTILFTGINFAPADNEFEGKVVKHNKAQSVQQAVDKAASAVISVEAIDLQTLFFAGDDYNAQKSKKILDELNRNRESLDAIAEQKVLVVGGTVTITAGVSIGYLVLLARGGLLLGSVMSSMPAWRFLDPVPVLNNFSEDDDDQDASLQQLVDKGNARGEREPQQGTEPEPDPDLSPGLGKMDASGSTGKNPQS